MTDSKVLSGSLDNSLRLWRSPWSVGNRLNDNLMLYPQSSLGFVVEVQLRFSFHCFTQIQATRLGRLGSLILQSGSDDKMVRVWDAITGDVLHSDEVWAGCCSPDGSRIVSGSRDRTMRMWDAVTGDMIQELTGYRSFVASCAFLLMAPKS